MKKTDIQIGGTYLAKVSGKLTTVKILNVSVYDGWDARNTVTGRDVRIRTAGKLRRGAGETTFQVTCPKCGVAYNSHYPQSDFASGKVSHRQELCNPDRLIQRQWAAQSAIREMTPAEEKQADAVEMEQRRKDDAPKELTEQELKEQSVDSILSAWRKL